MENSTENNKKVSKKKSLLNKFFKIVLPLGLGIGIIYYLVRDINPNELWAVIKDANWAILAFSLIFGLLGNTLRGYRWKLFINPLGYTPRTSSLCFAIYGGYAVNLVLPRAGEVWKCGVIAKDENIPFSKLFGTMLLDRVFDLFTVMFITIFAFFSNIDFFIKQLEGNKVMFDKVIDIISSPLLYIGILVIIGLIWAMFRFFGDNFIVKKIKGFIISIKQDMQAIWKMKTKMRLLLCTIGIWTSYFLYFYVTFFAFDFTKDLGFTAGLTAFTLGSISMGVPSNGGLGPWHIAIVASLGLYGVDKLSATGFATSVFTIQSIIWIMICGLFGIAALAIRSKKNG